MPRQFSFRGDRLAFSYGIVVLATIAASLIVIFSGETHLIIPLYAVGVFIDFTISQAGMIRHWRRERPAGWRRRLAINAFGCTLTAIVAVVVTIAKAPQSLIVCQPPTHPRIASGEIRRRRLSNIVWIEHARSPEVEGRTMRSLYPLPDS